jgi:cell wall-associated NlpC family hydrolase
MAVTGDQIAADALRYRGHPYVYGAWDCSGFVNHVLGQDLGMALPGGVRRFRGPPPHGPVVADYAGWAGAVTVGSPQRGDLAVWPGEGPDGHIGIVLAPNQMISALDPAYGTAVTAIAGFGPSGVQVEYRRVLGVAAGGAVSAVAGTGGGGQAMLVALLLLGAVALGTLLAAAVVGTVAAGVGTWGIARLAGSGDATVAGGPAPR